MTPPDEHPRLDATDVAHALNQVKFPATRGRLIEAAARRAPAVADRLRTLPRRKYESLAMVERDLGKASGPR